MSTQKELQKKKKKAAVAQQRAISKAVAKESAKYKPKGFIRRKAEQAATIGLAGAAGVAALKYQKGKVKKSINKAVEKGKAKANAAKTAARRETTFQTSKAKAAVGQLKDQGVQSAKKAAAPVAKQVSAGKARDAAARSALKNQVSKGKQREAAAKAALSKKAKAFKDRFKKKKPTNNFSRNLEFNKRKKSVSVRGYKRSDGTIVRPSTREIEQIQAPPGQGIRNLGIALASLAGAAATGASAYNTFISAGVKRDLASTKIRNDIINTDERKKQIDRDLSAIGETRKFLELAPGVGSAIRSTTGSLNEIRGFKGKAKRLEKELDLKKAGLRIRSEKNEIDREALKSKGVIGRAMNINARARMREVKAREKRQNKSRF